MNSEKKNDFHSYIENLRESQNKKNIKLSELLEKVAGKDKGKEKAAAEAFKEKLSGIEKEQSDSELEEAYRNTSEHIRIGNYS